MWWNVGPHLKRRMAHERGETGNREAGARRLTYFAGESAKEDFFEILRRKYGTLTRAWRTALDSDASGLLDAREFCAAMDVIGFVGNARSLWYNLDDDQSGHISLSEIDAPAAQALEKFRARCTKHFGSMDLAWKQCLDKDHSGALTLPELEIASQELGYTDMQEVTYLFNLLRLSPAAFRIPKHEVMFLQQWEDRKQITLQRAWRKGAGWVNKDPYFRTEPAKIPKSWNPRKTMFPKAKAHPPSRCGTPGLPKGDTPTLPVSPAPSKTKSVAYADVAPLCSVRLEKQAPPKLTHMSTSVSMVADVDECDSATEMSDFENFADAVAIDKPKAWTDFEEYLISTFGSLVQAFDVMDTSGDGSIERGEWMNMVTRRLRYCRASEALRLFDSKIVKKCKGARISYEDFGITNQERIIYNHDKRTEEQKSLNRSVQMKPVAFGGQGMRWELATEDHDTRMKCKPKKPPEAFWTTLPSGWGFPPSYINFRAVAAATRKPGHAGPSSARGSVLPVNFTEICTQPLSAR